MSAQLTKQVKIRLSDDLLVWLEEKAERERRPLSSLIRVILYEAKTREIEEALA